jgi:hypothetical protein
MSNELRRWMTLCETDEGDPFFTNLVENCRAIGRWYQGWFMRSSDQETLQRTIAAFRLAAPLQRFVGTQRLWRVVPASAVQGMTLVPTDKPLQSWSETEYGARMFFGSELSSRVTEPYVLTEAEIDGSWIVFSNAHLALLMDRLASMSDDDDRAARAWNLLEGMVRPHEYQHEVVVLLPDLRPLKLSATPDGMLGKHLAP